MHFCMWYSLPLFYIGKKLTPLISSNSVDVTLKVTVLEQSCNNVLLKGRYSAGVKSEAHVKILYKPLRQHHIADTQGRRYGFRKGVQINYVIPLGE